MGQTAATAGRVRRESRLWVSVSTAAPEKSEDENVLRTVMPSSEASSSRFVIVLTPCFGQPWFDVK